MHTLPPRWRNIASDSTRSPVEILLMGLANNAVVRHWVVQKTEHGLVVRKLEKE